MNANSFHGKPVIPAAVKDLDADVVVEVLSRHSINVSDAADELGVASADLRKLLWARPALADAAVEMEEKRLDLAEKNILEGLRSDDPRTRLASSMFVIRNTVRSRRRGWITSASAAVDVSINTSKPQTIFTWRPLPSSLTSDEAKAEEAHRISEVARAESEGVAVVSFSWRNPSKPDDDDEMEAALRDGNGSPVPRREPPMGEQGFESAAELESESVKSDV